MYIDESTRTFTIEHVKLVASCYEAIVHHKITTDRRTIMTSAIELRLKELTGSPDSVSHVFISLV